jgi:hypothetical protein
MVKLSVKTGNKYNEKRKIVNVVQNPKWKQEYAIEINNIEDQKHKENVSNNKPI